MGLTTGNTNSLAFKRLSGKAHTKWDFDITNEKFASNVQMAAVNVFANTIPVYPKTTLTTKYATDGVVERLIFIVEPVPNTISATNTSNSYRLRLPADYQTFGALKAYFSGYTNICDYAGRLQIISPSYGDPNVAPNDYQARLYTSAATESDIIPSTSNNFIALTDSINYNLDYYNGIIFIQNPPANYDTLNTRVGYVDAFLYVGGFVSDYISSGSSGSVSSKVNRSGDTMTGTLYAPGISGTTVSGGTLYSGSTNLYDIFSPIGSVVSSTPTYVQPGTNTYTGGTASNPTVNVSALTINTLTASGNSIFSGTLSGGSSFSANTIFSGTSNLSSLFVTPSQLALSQTHVQPGTNTYTGGTALDPTVNVSALTINTLTASGNSIFSGTLSGGSSFSANTLFSGTSNLSFLFVTPTQLVLSQTHVQPGTNTYTGGTALDPTVNVSALTINTLTASGNSVFSGTLSGGSAFSANTIFSGTSNLSSLFVTPGQLSASQTNVQPGTNTYTGGTATNPTVNVSALTINTLTASGNSVFNGTLSGGSSFSANTIFSGTSNLSSLFVTPSQLALSQTHVQPGTNTYTGGTALDPTVNVSALTINTLNASGNSIFSGTLSGGSAFSANTLFSGTTNLYNIFSSIGSVSGTNINNTAGTVPVYTGNTPGGNLAFYTLSGSSGVTVQVSNNILWISSPLNLANLGSGTGIISSRGANVFNFKSLSGVNGVLVTADSSLVYINASNLLSFSATTISGGTIFSGTSNLSSLFVTPGQLSASQTNVQPGTNTYTGGTATNPTVNVSALTINSLTASGNSVFSGTLSGGSSFSANTIFSGTSNLSSLFVTPGQLSASQTNVQPGTNTYTGGTATNPTVNVSALTINTLIASGNSVFSGTLSGGSSFSANTLFSGTSNLNNLFISVNNRTSIQNGTNTYTGGTAVNPTVNVSALTINTLTASGNSIFSGTLSGGSSFSANTLFSGTTNLTNIINNNNYWITGGTISITTKFGNNTVNAFYGFAAGKNNFLASYAAVFGKQNTSSNYGVTFGSGNTNINMFSFVAGLNQFSNDYSRYSFLGNGKNNRIYGNNGGYQWFNSVLNGKNNTVNYGRYSHILNGNYNKIDGVYGFVGQWNTILNGNNNLISGISTASNTILGGNSNSIKNNNNYNIIWGNTNEISATSWGIILSYTSVIKNSFHSSIIGGYFNDINQGQYGLMLEGTVNTIEKVSYFNSIINGRGNTIRSGGVINPSRYNTIISGFYNVVFSGVNHSTILGGLRISATTSNTVFADKLNLRSLTGATTRMVVADTYGTLSTQAIPSAGQSTVIRNGLNTYTAGTTADYTVNVSALTINTLTASGNSIFSGTLSGGSAFSANTLFSGTSNLSSLFVTPGQLSLSQTHVQPGTNTYTGGTALDPTVNVSALTINTLTASGNSIFSGTLSGGSSFSANTIFSGTSNLSSLFVTPGQLSASQTNVQPGTNTYTGGTALNPTVNVSALTINTLTASGNSVFRGTLSGGSSFSASTLFSGTSNLSSLFVTNATNIGGGAGTIFKQKTGSILEFKSILNGGNVTITNNTNDITLSVPAIPSSAYIWSYGAVISATKLTNGGNTALAIHSLVAGNSNYIQNYASYGTILNGKANNLTSVGLSMNFSSIINGYQNLLEKAKYSLIGTGRANQIKGYASVVDSYNTIINGAINRIYFGHNSSIISGTNHKIATPTNSLDMSFNIIGAGNNNYVKYGNYSSILNGNLNKIANYKTTNFYKFAQILNGKQNYVGPDNVSYSSIINGYDNQITIGKYNTILGGKNHLITNASYSVILNGAGYTVTQNNVVLAVRLRVPGTTSALASYMVTMGGTGYVYKTSLPVLSVNAGTNVTVGGTSQNPIISVTSLVINTLVASGNSIFRGTLSGGSSFSATTIFSGTSNLSSLFVSVNNRTSIQNGTNTYTGGTPVNPTVNVSALTINSLIVSGNTVLSSTTASTITVRSLSGGGTLMVVTDNNGLLSTQAIPSAGQSTVIRNGLNTYTAGTTADYTVNVSALTINTLTASGNSVFSGTLSGGSSFSANTLFSGTTNLYSIFSPIGSVGGSSTNVQPGTNTYTGGTATNPTVNVSALTINTLTASGSSLFSGNVTLQGNIPNNNVTWDSPNNTLTFSGSYISIVNQTLSPQIYANFGATGLHFDGYNNLSLHTLNQQRFYISSAGTVSVNNNISNSTIKFYVSGDSFFNGSTSATTIFSGTSNLDSLFVTTGNTVFVRGSSANSVKLNNPNVSTSGIYSFAIGQNSIINNGPYSSVLNGRNNSISGTQYASIIGGFSSVISGINSYSGVIVGGRNNTMIQGQKSLIIGGSYNTVSATTASLIANSTTSYARNSSSHITILSSYRGYIDASSYSNLIGVKWSYIHPGVSQSAMIGAAFSTIKTTSSYNAIISSYSTYIGSGSPGNTMINVRIGSIGDNIRRSSLINVKNSYIRGGSTNYATTYASIINSTFSIIESGTSLSTIISGTNNKINNGVTGATIIAINNYTATTNNTLHTNQLKVRTLTGATTRMVVADSDGLLSTQTIPTGGGGGASVNNGINTFTAGTSAFQSVNVTALTINTLTASGNSVFTGVFSAITANTSYLKVNTLSGHTTNPERVILYDIQPTSYSNVLVGIASAQTYAQLNIRNIHGGNQASSDIVATADNGSESTNYIDMGINSSTFTGYVGFANDGYLYTTGNDLWIGTVTSNKSIRFITDGTGLTSVRMTVSSGGTYINKLSADTIFSGSTLLSTIIFQSTLRMMALGI